jgi:polyhydroxyalkanoate synthesis regulator phasin
LVHKYAQKLTQALADRKVEYRNRATQLDLTRQERYRRMEDEAREQSERETVIVDTLDLAAQEVYNAISSGTISEEEGQAELRARKEEAVRSADMNARFEAAAQRIKAFVAAGRMSKEEAQESLETLKKEMAKAREGVSERDQAEIDSRIGARARLNFTFNTQDQQRPITRGEYGNIADELTAAVDAGKISREDARARLNVLEQRMREQHNEQQDRITSIKQRVDVAVEKIRAAVKSGHISAEEGRGELMELRQKLAEIEAELAARDEYRQLEPRVERLRLLEDREVALKEKDMKMEYEVVMQQIRKAVAAGEMTREDATKKLAKMKEAMNKASGSDGEE